MEPTSPMAASLTEVAVVGSGGDGLVAAAVDDNN